VMEASTLDGRHLQIKVLRARRLGRQLLNSTLVLPLVSRTRAPGLTLSGSNRWSTKPSDTPRRSGGGRCRCFRWSPRDTAEEDAILVVETRGGTWRRVGAAEVSDVLVGDLWRGRSLDARAGISRTGPRCTSTSGPCRSHGERSAGSVVPTRRQRRRRSGRIEHNCS
jgi:hypothetical protein